MDDNAIDVLLIEDDEDDIFITRHLLDESGAQNFKVSVAETLECALSTIETNPPQVILLDLSLPDSQGLETLSAVLSLAKEIPVILLTGVVDKALGLKAVQQGAQDFLFKGHLERERLWRSIHYAIERKRYEIELKRYRDKLEERVKERTKELQDANMRLTREIRIRQEAERNTENAKRYLESIIRTSQDGIAVVNSKGLFEFCNDAFIKIVGWPREEIIGFSFFKVIDKKTCRKYESAGSGFRKELPHPV